MKALAGRRIVVTRHAPMLTERLTAEGADVVELPTIAIGPAPDSTLLAAAVGRLGLYDWIAFTSANAVRAVAEVLAELQMDLPATVKVASVGRATTDAIRAAWPGRRPDLEPGAVFSAEGLLAAWPGKDVDGARILLPVSDRASDVLERGLQSRGADVERITAYTTAVDTADPAAWSAVQQRGVDLIVFASPSAVEGFVALAGQGASEVPAAVIGPTTASAARLAGFRVVAQPSLSTLEALASTITAALGHEAAE
jgi:uroporphyrinogen III methyltransferase/synthase